jgi:hypothetical protein
MEQASPERIPGSPPVCPLHKRNMARSAETDRLTDGTRNLVEFVCYERMHSDAASARCLSTARIARPDCKHCKQPMKLGLVKMGLEPNAWTYEWKCCHKLEFELCDCGSVGWLHMGHDGDRDSQTIGHDGGNHIESCNDCGHLRFADDIGAERAHRRECGCGHGLPTNDQEYDWIDYGGRSGEIYYSMIHAGFRTAILEFDSIEAYRIIDVYIPEGQAGEFIKTLDEAHDKLDSQRKKLLRQAAKCVSFTNNNNYASGLSAERFTRIKLEDNMREGEYTLYTLQVDGRVTDRRYTGECHDATIKAKSRYTHEEIWKAGAVQIVRRDGTPRLTTTGHPIVVLEDIKVALERFDPEIKEEAKRQADRKIKDVGETMTSAMQDINRAALALLGQLNEMLFTDFSIKDQRALESRRRALLDAISPFADKLGGFSADRHTNVLPTAGGYRIGDLIAHGEDGVLEGHIYLDGIYHHVILIEVHDVGGEQQPVNDPNDWYYNFVGRFNEEAMKTVKVAGFPGDYVLCIYPGAR